MTLEPLDSRHLQLFVDENRIAAKIIPLSVRTATVADAADALGVAAEQIIKSLVFRIDEAPLLVINNGLARVDRKKLAAVTGVGRKRVKFASPEQALSITGYGVGAMPPFGHRTRLRTIVDAAVMELDEIYGGGGSIDAMMRLTPDELVRVTCSEVVDISE
jgi:Cys-tRNA(Pro) deacylase